MKPFFSDKEIRKFSFKEKITYIFNQLYIILQPVEKKPFHQTITFNEKKISFINEIELPFSDILVKSDPLQIEITGDNFCYRFPPIMMSQIWYRLKKML